MDSDFDEIETGGPAADQDIAVDYGEPLLAVPGEFTEVFVPERGYLMIDGRGGPESEEYRAGAAAITAAAEAVQDVVREFVGRGFRVAPLQTLWTATPRSEASGRWGRQWTILIAQPEWVDADLAEAGIARARTATGLPGSDRIRFETLTEGRSVQVLHVGPYEGAAEAIETLNRDILPARGLVAGGRYHEIYLDEPGSTAPSERRTLLRQPVEARAQQPVAPLAEDWLPAAC